nr:efflux RND transporter periplasmic adaptor subunit [Neptunicella marina]
MPQTNTENQPVAATAKPVTKTALPAAVTSNKSLENDAVLNASGYITARRMATVSAEIMGLITDVRVEEGMTVEQGQILATLDDAIARSNLDFARAQIDVLTARKESAEANLAEAKLNLQRVTENGYSSEADITRSTTDVKNQSASLKGLEADIKVARIEVQRQQERFDDHTIRAPFAGVVIGKNAQPGEIVAPTSAGGGFTRTGICTIVDMDSLEIEVDVNESFIGRVQPGQKVEATLEAYPDWKIPATVIAIIPTADRAKATVRVRIGIDQKDSRILPDMGVKVAFLKE